MKDITAILIHYSSRAALYKALHSLEKIRADVQSIIIIQDQEIMNLSLERAWYQPITFIKPAHTLDKIIPEIMTPYILFLQDRDCLSPTINSVQLQLPYPNTALITTRQNQKAVNPHPLLVATPFLHKHKLFPSAQLPFKEALFPAWLANIDNKHLLMKEGLLRQSGKNRSMNSIEKETFLQKYQLKKISRADLSLTVIITNYNMEHYVEAAILSSLLQNEAFEHIFIIDDGSTDNSYLQIQQWQDKEQVQIFHKENEGKAKALNHLLSHITTDFILELDADDWLDPNAASVIKQHLASLPEDISVLYGNFRKWKQKTNDVLFKGIAQGRQVNNLHDLLSYRFPLGPRIYRTSILKGEGGFPVITFENGRMYEDVSVLIQLIKNHPFRYADFTVYNVREHPESITKKNKSKWSDYLNALDLN